MNQGVDPIVATQALGGAAGDGGEVLAPGALVASRYRIEALLGEGGMGAVYRAHDVELDEAVALKTLGQGASADSAAIERFRREVKLARRVTHPNVARTFDLGATEGVRFITMELIEGVSLARRIEDGAMSLSEALRICADIARGLVAAHSAGVVHRDLKPDNVMLAGAQGGAPLTGQERVVITDFGIARAADGDRGGADERPESQRGKPLTVGVIVGTPAYMAPEQIVGETPDGRSDVYALGVLLFEMLSGRRPFDGQSAVDVAMARLTRAAPDVREVNAALPEPVAELVASMLARDRRARPDAAAVLDTIEQLRGVNREVSASSMAGLARMPGSATAMLESGSVPRIKSVAVLALSSAEPALGAFARELGATLADALSRSRSLRVIPPSVAGDDLGALSKASRADVALGGSVRSEGERLRVNLRCIDLALGTQRWAERFEGTAAAPFALEDSLTRAAEAALRALASGPGEAPLVGPSDPTARALYERALEASHRMNDLPALEEALVLARKAHAMVPADAAVMSLLGLVLVRLGVARRDGDPSVIAEAEDWALRALNADAGSAPTFATLGLVRLHQGDLRASARAFREALARDPRNAEASAYLGRFLIESGHVDEGIRRLEFALTIEPSIQHAWWNLARSHALLSRWDKTEEILDTATAATGNGISANVVRARVSLWRRDRRYAAATADRIEGATPPDHFLRAFVPTLRAFAAGEKVVEQAEALRAAGERVPSLALKAFWCQVAAEAFALSGRVDAALDAIDAAVSLPFIDVGWMDHCPVFDVVRGAGRFGQARAIVAARAASLWK